MRTAIIVAACLLAALPLAFAQDGAPSGSASATIEVRVPPGAIVTFDTYPTLSRGAARTFYTPALARGKTFSYEVVAVWNDKGQPRKLVQQVTVRGGETSVVDFTSG